MQEVKWPPAQDPEPKKSEDLNDPKNWRTQEQLQASFQTYDFEKNGVISLAYANQALKDSGIVLDPAELKSIVAQLAQESWEGQRTIDFNKLIPMIAKDPPGYVRTGPVAPRHAPRELLVQETMNRSIRSNSSSLSGLPPKPKTA